MPSEETPGRECEWGREDTKQAKSPSVSGPEPRPLAAERALAVPASPPERALGLAPGAAEEGLLGAGCTPGAGSLWSGSTAQLPELPRAPPLPAVGPGPRPVHRQVRTRTGRAKLGAGCVEGGVPAQQLPSSSHRPQTFTKRRVRPHQSPLIIVGWAAGGGRRVSGRRAGQASGNGLCGGSGSRARRRRAEGGSEA